MASATAQVEQMRQALLAKAFRGELAPQDPNGEPAEALLDRLKADSVASGNQGRVGKGRPRSKSAAAETRPGESPPDGRRMA